MIFNFRTGAASGQLSRMTRKAIEAFSVYTLPPLGEVRFEQVHQDGDRFVYTKGEDRYLMFAYLPRFETAKHKQLPKFHTCRCAVRQAYTGYVFSPKMPVDIWSKDEGRLYQAQNLTMCKRCRSMVTRSLFGARGELPWYEYVLQEAERRRPLRSDGYIDLWRQVSEAVREKAGWTCQQCRIRLPMPEKGYYLEVHHKDRDKSNNAEANLVALCIACHAEQDDQHRLNYAQGPNLLKLEEFKSKRSYWKLNT